jgi:hypothetical protein
MLNIETAVKCGPVILKGKIRVCNCCGYSYHARDGAERDVNEWFYHYWYDVALKNDKI